MKIKITGICNFMGRPASVGDVIETRNHMEEAAAGYLVSIQKAEEVTPMISTNAEENALLESTTTPDLSPKEGRAEKKSHGHRKTAAPTEDLR